MWDGHAPGDADAAAHKRFAAKEKSDQAGGNVYVIQLKTPCEHLFSPEQRWLFPLCGRKCLTVGFQQFSVAVIPHGAAAKVRVNRTFRPRAPAA